MKKKFYFYSLKARIAYIIPASIFITMLVLLIVFRKTQQTQVVAIVASMLSFVILLFTVGIVFMFFIRIEFDYDKKELFIHKPYFIKRIKFEEIENVEIIDYDSPGFDFVVTTKNFTKRISYFTLPIINKKTM